MNWRYFEREFHSQQNVYCKKINCPFAKDTLLYFKGRNASEIKVKCELRLSISCWK